MKWESNTIGDMFLVEQLVFSNRKLKDVKDFPCIVSLDVLYYCRFSREERFLSTPTKEGTTTMKRNTTTSLKPRVIVGFNTATLAFSDKRRKSRKRVKEELCQLY